MFIGHIALGFGAKRLAPRQSLAVLITAPVWNDVLWPVFLLLGIERFTITPGAFPPLRFDWYPWSHSLLLDLGWSALFGFVVWRLTKDPRGALVCGLLVLSHWVLDFVSHHPDMPLWPGSPLLGLGLWRSKAATVIVESVMFVACVGLYLRSTRARDRIGSIGCWAFLLLLVVANVANMQGTPPPNQAAVAVSGLLAVMLTTPLAWWFDQHREVIA